MLFYLTTLNLARFLNEDGPKLDVGETDKEKLAPVDAWNHSDFLCHNYVLNGLENTLYNVYSPLKTAKELWDSLDKKYKTEDAGLKKFIVGKFLDFKMVDSKIVLSQVQELHVTPGSQSDPIGESKPKSGARYDLYYIYLYTILYTVLGLSLTCSFLELYLYL